jgi:hypothetical protein
VENSQHYVRDFTFWQDAQRARIGKQPNAFAAIRNLVTGAFRKKGHANIAAARRYHGHDDQRILALYGRRGQFPSAVARCDAVFASSAAGSRFSQVPQPRAAVVRFRSMRTSSDLQWWRRLRR